MEVLRDGQWLWLTWQQIQVGDVVRVRAAAFFPADLLLLSSRYLYLLINYQHHYFISSSLLSKKKEDRKCLLSHQRVWRAALRVPTKLEHPEHSMSFVYLFIYFVVIHTLLELLSII